MDLLSLGNLVAAHQISALDDFVTDRTEIAVFKAGSAGSVQQMKRNVLVLGRGMDLDRDGHQAKGEHPAGDRSSHGVKFNRGERA